MRRWMLACASRGNSMTWSAIKNRCEIFKLTLDPGPNRPITFVTEEPAAEAARGGP